MKRKKKKRLSLLSIFLIALTVVMIVIAVGLIFWVISRMDKKEIVRKNFSEIDSSLPNEGLSPSDIDTELVKQNSAFVEVPTDTADDGTLAVLDASSNPDEAPSDLTLLYNGLFSSDGLQIASEKSAKFKCRRDALQPLNDMLKAFYNDTSKRNLIINSAYEQKKSEDDSSSQTEYYSDYGGYYDEYGNYISYDYNYGYTDSETDEDEEELCAEHENGCSFDIGIYDSDSDSIEELSGDEYEWLAANAYKYGFVLRYPEDKDSLTGFSFNASHFRYVGKEAAAVMNEKGFCLEEYLTFIKSYSYDSPLISVIDGRYEMSWYIADSGLDTISLQIPSINGQNADYTISYNGSDGFVVTAVLSEDFTVSKTASADSSDISDTSEQSESGQY